MSKKEIDLSELAADAGRPGVTDVIERHGGGAHAIRRFQLVGVEGPLSGRTWESASDRCSIGSHPSNDLVIDDATVSRFHCELRVDAGGVRVRDLESSNGVTVDGLRVVEAWLRSGSVLRLGNAALRLVAGGDPAPVAIADRTEFGGLVGASVAMRATFSLLAKVAVTEATVLIEGETGTGKELAAESIHAASPRAPGPFLVIDCGAIPASLLESELFGHEKGAFTGASARRQGIFEEAGGGTVFLDEVGELPPDLQPKLLRVLERREIRRVGANRAQPIDVRVIAATHRDLRAEVNAGRFRSDLYFRLAVVRVPLPPLRERPEDLALLAERLVVSLAGPDAARRLLTPELYATLRHHAWPGNVRELRNYLERCLVMEQPLPLADASPAGAAQVDPTRTYAEERRRAIDEFERRYLEALLALHKGKVSQAARAADMDRVYLYKLLDRHKLR